MEGEEVEGESEPLVEGRVEGEEEGGGVVVVVVGWWLGGGRAAEGEEREGVGGGEREGEGRVG